MINAHKSEAAADLRSFFGVSLWAVPLYELWHLVTMLMKDPASRLHAATGGWDFPASREWFVLADMVDVLVAGKSARRPKPYPRPQAPQNRSTVGKSAVKRTPAELRALLDSPEV